VNLLIKPLTFELNENIELDQYLAIKLAREYGGRVVKVITKPRPYQDSCFI
jgi:hypothetical protein